MKKLNKNKSIKMKHNSHNSQSKIKESSNKSSIIVQAILLLIIVIAIISLIFTNTFSSVEKEFKTFEFNLNLSSENFSNLRGQEELAQMKITNLNSFLSVRVEVEEVYLCIRDSQTQELVSSSRLNRQTQHNTELGIFTDIQYYDIRAGQTIIIEYTLFIQQIINENLYSLNEENMLEIEFRTSPRNSFSNAFARDVCLGNERYSILE